MIGNAPQSHITKVPGWETIAEQEYLIQLARSIPPDGVILEIGGEWGMSASLFAHATPSTVRIVTIDIFSGSLLTSHRANLSEAGLSGRTEQIVGDSKQVIDGWDTELDLLFIDGDHSYAGAKADFENWTRFVKVGGLLLVHDTAIASNPLPHPLHFEVSRAMIEWLNTQDGAWETLRAVDTLSVFRRVKAAKVDDADNQTQQDGEETPEAKAKAKNSTGRKSTRKTTRRSTRKG